MDGKERVRVKAAKRARRCLKKSGEKNSSTDSGSGSSATNPGGEEDQAVFSQPTKVRTLAEKFPGVLTSQALQQMRQTLLQNLGEDDHQPGGRAVAVQYFRQVLQRRANGPLQRELLTLSMALDLLTKGKCAAACDLIVQRIKSQELTMSGSHWSVSQRLEVAPPEHQNLAAAAELKDAQKDIYGEAKVRHLASFPEGRPLGRGGKSQGKSSDGKDPQGWKGDRGRKGGKGQGNKGDGGKKKDEGPKP